MNSEMGERSLERRRRPPPRLAAATLRSASAVATPCRRPPGGSRRDSIRRGARRPRHPQQAPAGAARSCCAWRRCAARLRVVVAARARLRRGRAGDLHRAGPQGSGPWVSVEREQRAARHRTLPAVRLPAHRAAVRALGAVRRARAAARALADRRLAVPGRLRRADLRGRQRRTLLELLPLLRLARVRAALRVLAARALRARHGRRCCAPPATGAARCSSAPASTSATSPTRSPTHPHSPIEVVGFLSPERAARQRPALARHAATTSTRCSARERIDEVIIADPDFPQDEAVELVDQCHRRGVRVRLAPSTMEILIHRAEFVPGQSVPLFELGPPVFEGIDFALKRTFDVVGASAAAARAEPAAARDRARRARSARAARSSSARCAAASASARSRA